MSGNLPLVLALSLGGGLALLFLTYGRNQPLRGPPRGSLINGQFSSLFRSEDVVRKVQSWAATYGGAFYRPGPLGVGDIMVTDPVAIDHIFKKVFTYYTHSLPKKNMQHTVGHGALVETDGEIHRLHRKAVAPGFANVRVREYMPMFYESSSRLVAQWDQKAEATGSFETDVQGWFSAYALDTIGLGGFGHDFRVLTGEESDVFKALRDMELAKKSSTDPWTFILHMRFGSINMYLTDRQKCMERFKSACGAVANVMLEKIRRDKSESSIIARLINAERPPSNHKLTESDIIAQMRGVVAAGYETTSASLTWIIIELCKSPKLQARLREEVTNAFPINNPDFDDISTSLPLLDAIVHEVLRLHPALPDVWREAQVDDMLPLSTPITLKNGKETSEVFVAKGTRLIIPIVALNRSQPIWGEDAWEFNADRWLTGSSPVTQDLPGYRNLLTFLDGPKSCLGRAFAVANFKVAIATLIRKYSFELPNGPDTPISTIATVVARPRVDGESGCTVPIRITKLVA